jgi:hypothetical protein
MSVLFRFLQPSSPYDKQELQTPLAPPSVGNRRKFRPNITVDTSRIGGKGLYFPGCGKQVPKETCTPDDTDSHSSSPEMRDDEEVQVDDIILTRTGYVDDVVTPYMPKLPESCWAFTKTQNVERIGVSYKTPSPPPNPPARATRRVSFSEDCAVSMIPNVEYMESS